MDATRKFMKSGQFSDVANVGIKHTHKLKRTNHIVEEDHKNNVYGFYYHLDLLQSKLYVAYLIH